MTATSRVLQAPFTALDRVRASASNVADRVTLASLRFAPPATGFVLRPEPRSNGLAARGMQMLAGNYLVDGSVIEHGGYSPWDLDAPSRIADLHGFDWLDDLGAVDTPKARAKAQDWLFDWIARYDAGRGPGWTPDVTGRRVVRWIHHAILLLSGRSPQDSRAFFKCLGQQARYLRHRWQAVPPGLPRFEALTGLVYAGLALEGIDGTLQAALKALGRECAAQIDADGGLRGRNPVDLAEVFTMLAWINQAVSSSRQPMDVAVLRALERMAPAIRALRHGNGCLARFHGSDGGQPDRIDRALADGGVRTPAASDGAMGFSRLSAGHTLLLVDTGPPPPARLSQDVHQSVLSFEMSSGRHPVLCNLGPVLHFGAQYQDRTRAPAAHNGLTLEGLASANAEPENTVAPDPRKVSCARVADENGTAVTMEHDGYRRTLGLSHERKMRLSHTGTLIEGQDRLHAAGKTDQERLTAWLEHTGRVNVGAALWFHAHPDAHVSLDLGGRAASFRVSEDELWVLRMRGGRLRLQDGDYLERGRLQPRATQSVVVSFDVDGYESAVNWTLTRMD